MTIVELALVMLIIAIIALIAVGSLRSGTARGSLAQARTVARTLDEGVQQFQRDHGGRLPDAVGSADWVGASPIDQANGDKPYVRASALEPLQSGSVLLEGAALGAAGRGAAPARIRYVLNAAGDSYAFVVDDMRTGNPECHVTSARGGSASGFLQGLGTGGREC